MTGPIQPRLRSPNRGGLDAAVRPQGRTAHSTCTYLHLLAVTCTNLHKKNYFAAVIFPSFLSDRGCARRASYDIPFRVRGRDSALFGQNRTKPDDRGRGGKTESLIINHFRIQTGRPRPVLPSRNRPFSVAQSGTLLYRRMAFCTPFRRPEPPLFTAFNPFNPFNSFNSFNLCNPHFRATHPPIHPSIHPFIHPSNDPLRH